MLLSLFKRADEVRERSCDKHTKLGAIVVDIHGKVLVESCNTIPEGLDVTDDRLERPVKYQYIEHAERNVCFYAAKHGIKLAGTILIMSCNPVPCTECARAVIQSGIAMIVGRDGANTASGKWDESCKFALGLLKEAGVVVVFVNGDTKLNVVGTLSPECRFFLEDTLKTG